MDDFRSLLLGEHIDLTTLVSRGRHRGIRAEILSRIYWPRRGGTLFSEIVQFWITVHYKYIHSIFVTTHLTARASSGQYRTVFCLPIFLRAGRVVSSLKCGGSGIARMFTEQVICCVFYAKLGSKVLTQVHTTYIEDTEALVVCLLDKTLSRPSFSRRDPA